MQRGEPVEDLVSIEVNPREENKTVRIGSNLKEDTKLELVNLLRTYADIFAWTAVYMPRIDPEVITHRLNVDPSKKPVKRKKRTFAPGRQEKIEEEVDKLLTANFIEKIYYPDWIANVFMCTLPEDPPQLVISKVPDPWTLYVDGSLAIGSSGAGIILISLEGFVVEYAFRFGFQALNNEAEYEALLAGIRLAHALKEVYEGICGQLLGGRTLAQKILRQGYYWPIMQKDAIEFTRRCGKCQRFSPVTHTLVAPLTSIVSPIPFAIWGMDLLGPFPVASGQRRFVIVAIDYFTKWIEAKSLATITSAKCEDFFWKNVVCRFGVPKALVVDNGKQFDNKNFQTF
ncbi:hypothetical protein RJ639_045867 [Escallonia herrerae]|uniref:Integrase catalytic domain-containing protein n=1 Tax=Escallonia herrerae TaxID=1293975 RepID=A0AA88W8Y8_9ASTE|nr:hypothetical protein RJ639_045867 [Escallonia herrerae]